MSVFRILISDVLRGNELPDFVGQAAENNYSADFDDEVMEDCGSVSSESSCSIPEEFEQNVSISNSSFQVPKLSTAKTNRKTWKLDASFERPAWARKDTLNTSNIERKSSSSSISSSNSNENQESAASQLRNLNRTRRQKNWLEESWNLISEFERNNKGRNSVVISVEQEDSPDYQIEENIPEAIIEVNDKPMNRVHTRSNGQLSSDINTSNKHH